MQRRRGEIGALRERFSEALGASYVARLPAAARRDLLASRDTQERIAELGQRAFELDEELARRGEELEAVRQLTRS